MKRRRRAAMEERSCLITPCAAVAGSALVTFAGCRAARAEDVAPANESSQQRAEPDVRASVTAPPNAVGAPRDTHSERPSPLRGELELAGFVATPFEGSGGSLGLGWRMLLGVGWGSIPVTLGFDFQSAYFGEATSRENVGAWNYPLLVDKTRRDTALFFDGVLRVQPPYWSVRPYVEGIFGRSSFKPGIRSRSWAAPAVRIP